MNRNEKRFDWRAASLLAPAVAYTIGLILYSGEGLFPGALTMHAARLAGAWLMVAGAEGGTLSAIIEVARKLGIGKARWYDLAGIAVSMLATVFNLLLVWAREATAESWWVAWLLQNGALATILAQVGDFYAGAAFELGLFYAYVREERRAAALQDKRDELGFERAAMALEAERMALTQSAAGNETATLRQQVAELTTALRQANAELDARDSDATVTRQLEATTPTNSDKPATTADGDATNQRQTNDTPPNVADNADTPTTTRRQWRDIAATLGDNAPTTARAIVAWLEAHGHRPPTVRTVERWLEKK